MRVALIHNPTSGDAHPTGDELVALLAAYGHDVDYYSSKREWRVVVDESPELIALAGGDGTIRKIARKLVDTALPLAILPLGTANNVARALGLTDIPIAELVAGWSTGIIQGFDLGVVEGSWGSDQFLESVGMGLLADTMHEIDTGGSGYVNVLEGAELRMSAALDVLEEVATRSSPFHARLRLDDRTIEGEYVMVEILNFGAAGPNLQLSPRGNPSDAALDVVSLEWSNRHRLKDFLASRRGAARQPSQLPLSRAREVQVDASGGSLHVDDEVRMPGTGSTTHFVATIWPAALQVLLPRRREADSQSR
jgi:diacylglycerol kinase (ATP)